MSFETGRFSVSQITLKDKHQLTAVAYATKHVNILKLFPPMDPWIQQQAFVHAASIGSLGALEWLLTDRIYSAIDINGIDEIHGETGRERETIVMSFIFLSLLFIVSALTSAASHGHMTIVDYLISNHQADIDRVNAREMTPLLLAVKTGMWSCVEYLLDHQASIEHCDKQKRTCLIIAASEGHLAVIDSLLEKGFHCEREKKMFVRCSMFRGQCSS